MIQRLLNGEPLEDEEQGESDAKRGDGKLSGTTINLTRQISNFRNIMFWRAIMK